VNNLSIINLSKGFISQKVFSEQNPLYLKYIKKISCGDGFTVCVDKDGVVYSWGKSTRGQLGYELKYDESTLVSGTKCQSTPRVVQSLHERKISIVDVICGGDFTIAVDDQGRGFSWGNNDHYQLGRSTERTMEATPEISDQFAQFEKISKICCGWMHVAILTDQGEVYYWGNPFYDYAKHLKDIKEPMKVELPFKAVDLACGFHHFAAIVYDEFNYELYTWGANEYGQCGLHASQDSKLLFNPVYIQFSELKIMNVYCGAFHTICHMTGDKLYGFGHN
jgi:alpha-tubulin suppressor-like RCC1 family protein